MKIRIIGTASEIAFAERAIRALFAVHRISDPILARNGRGLIRVYVEASEPRTASDNHRTVAQFIAPGEGS